MSAWAFTGIGVAQGIRDEAALYDANDTIAAIAGSLLGAWCGADAIPREWTDVVHGWPGYDGAGLRELAAVIVG